MIQPLTSLKTSLHDLTQHEILALQTRLNLADAHTHQGQSPTQQGIVDRLPELWYEAEERFQADFEREVMDAFFRLHGQHTAQRAGKSLLSYAASISTLVVAMYLKQNNIDVTLIEPCFDNLHDVLKNIGVIPQPISEDLFRDADGIYENLVRHVRTEALFLVDPNNPTGFSLLAHGRKGFEEVVRYCSDMKKLLVLDLCFASFALADERHGRFDLYELLEQSGVSYLALEDTGKTWPIQDAKCAILTASNDIWHKANNIHTSVLLNVSPFVLNIVKHYIEDSIADNMASVRNVVTENRIAIQKAMNGSILEYQEPVVNVSVAWFRINHPELAATTLQEYLVTKGIYILPGTYFYWQNSANGQDYIRVALARDPQMFEVAADKIRQELSRYE